MGYGGTHSKRVVLILIAAAMLCFGAAGVAIADAGADADNDELTVLGDDTDDTYHATSADDDTGSGIGMQSAGDDIEVAVTAAPTGQTYASDDTIHAFAGVFDDSGEPAQPLEGEDVTVEIEDPSGDVETYSETTDDDGSVDVEYDLESRDDGEYVIRVTHDDSGTEAVLSVEVGVSLDVTTNTNRDRSAYIGDETTVAFLARNGEQPESDFEVDLEVTDMDSGDEVKSETLETDSDGFVAISFLPTEATDYEVTATAESGDRSLSASEVISGTEKAVTTDYFTARPATQGQESSYFGQVASADGPVSNTDIVAELIDDDTDETVATVETETDDGGFFTADYTAPDDAEELRVEMETAAGDPIYVSGAFEGTIPVDTAPTDDDDDNGDVEFVDFSASAMEFSAAPGGEMTVEINALEGGDPIANEDVDIVVRYGFAASGAPVFSETVETDADGQIEESIPIPENAPDGDRVGATAVLEYDGETYVDRFSVSVEAFDIDFRTPFDGDEATLEVTDAETGDPVEGVPLQFDAQIAGDRTTSFQTEAMSSDASGEDAVTVDTPERPGFLIAYNSLSRYDDRGSFTIDRVEYPGSMTVTQDTAQPGETVTIEFDTENDATASGIVFGDTEFPETALAAHITSEETAEITVPEIASDGDTLSLRVWAADDDGELYEASAFNAITVEVPDETAAEFTVDPAEPFDGQSVTFDASASTSAEGDLTYEWDFDDGSTTETSDAIVEHEFDTPGEYDVTLTVIDDAGDSDTTTQTVTVVEEPVVNADFGIDPAEPQANETVTFDASDSTAQADIEEYVWEFGDGTTETTTDPVVTHEYDSSGTYDVELTVVDVDGNADTEARTLDVAVDDEFLEGDGAGFGPVVAALALLASALLYRRR